jgi:hypothetical protein
LEFKDASLIVADGHVSLAPSPIRTTSNDEGTIQGDYDLSRNGLTVTLTSRGMDISALRHHAEVTGVPVLRDLQSGVWKGQLSYTSDPGMAPPATGRWTGSVDVQRATITLPLFAAPVRVASAHAELDGTSLVVRKIQARAGDLSVTGDYRYEVGALRPHRFHLAAVRVSGPQLESLFRPALYRGGLVSRALGLKRSEVPDWLAQMRADGNIDIGALDLGGFAFEHMSSRVIWDGAHLKLAGTKAHFSGGSVTALVEADLTASVPLYHAAGSIAGFGWRGGKVSADMTVDTSGAGAETLGNLRADGSFNARGVEMNYTSMEGCFQFAWGGKPRVKLNSLQLSDGETTFIGSGSTAANGELVLDLGGVAKPVRLTLR